MGPSIAGAHITLTYPIYVADFDARNSGFLFVGGGGGEGRSGIGNKITLIDTSKRQDISEVVDVDLSRDEDSVTSLAVAQSDETSAVVFAGINSSEKEQAAGNNEHLRSFRLRYPLNTRREGKNSDDKAGRITGTSLQSQALSKASLFSPSGVSKPETYQRVLRLSPPGGNIATRIGAVATGLAPAGEIVIFDAFRSTPDKTDIRRRIQLQQGEEASDVDIIETGDGGHLVAYCTEEGVYLCSISPLMNTNLEAPILLHGRIADDTSSARTVKLRSLRFLTPDLLLLLCNFPANSGSELILLQVSGSPKVGSVTLRRKLHKNIKSATALATTRLPGPSPGQVIQHAIAVAGQDRSLSVLTIDHPKVSNQKLSFHTHSFYRDVHPLQITALAFSNFIPPADPASALPQYLKLASTSMSNTVVVHTLPLTPDFPPSAGQKGPTRYILKVPGTRSVQTGLSILVGAIIVAFAAFLLQAFSEIRDVSPDYLGAKNWLSQSLQHKIAGLHIVPKPSNHVTNVPDITAKATDIEEAVKDALRSMAEATNKIPSAADIKEQIAAADLGKRMPSAENIIENIPSAEDLLAKMPGVQEFNEHFAAAANLGQNLPGTAALKENMPSIHDVKQRIHIPDLESAKQKVLKAADDAAALFSDVSSRVSASKPVQSIRSVLASFHALRSDTDQKKKDYRYVPSAEVAKKALLVSESETGLSAEVHDDRSTLEGVARKFEDLKPRERETWKARLKEGGHWVEEEGEALLKGVFFGTLAGTIRAVI